MGTSFTIHKPLSLIYHRSSNSYPFDMDGFVSLAISLTLEVSTASDSWPQLFFIPTLIVIPSISH